MEFQSSNVKGRRISRISVGTLHEKCTKAVGFRKEDKGQLLISVFFKGSILFQILLELILKAQRRTRGIFSRLRVEECHMNSHRPYNPIGSRKQRQKIQGIVNLNNGNTFAVR